MCLLVVCNPNSTPSKDDLHNGACSNPHGFGFAIQTPEGIISERSMSAKKSVKRFLELREQYPEGYAMWHARYATHGVKNEQNCHPFQVGGSDLTYLAHNGVLDIHIPKGDKRSDTRIMAEELLPRLGGVSALDDEYVYDMVSSWSSGSKVAIMTLDPSAKYTMYIINESLGTWDDSGVWWSNQSHKRTQSTPRTTSYTNYYGYDDYLDKSISGSMELDDYNADILAKCMWCDEDVDMEDNPYYCDMCMNCFDCGMTMTDCMCYNEADKFSIVQEQEYINRYLSDDNWHSKKWYSKEPLDF